MQALSWLGWGNGVPLTVYLIEQQSALRTVVFTSLCSVNALAKSTCNELIFSVKSSIVGVPTC